MQSELKPCAHCGGEARLWSVIMPFDADCDSITVQCADCDAIGADVLVDQDVHSQSDLAALEVEAIAAWNTRASDAEISRLTEALRAAEEREAVLRELGKPFIFAVAHCKAIGKRPHDLVLTSEFEALAAAINGAKP